MPQTPTTKIKPFSYQGNNHYDRLHAFDEWIHDVLDDETANEISKAVFGITTPLDQALDKSIQLAYKLSRIGAEQGKAIREIHKALSKANHTLEDDELARSFECYEQAIKAMDAYILAEALNHTKL